ncbi:S-adenosyl-L-methionine-dependent methyltransferase [Triangularia setosa]|uniref:S-adenosyl-L-methionine-dependent methyltransferase n=1 Tax=Triangularia setosa TaxID=2587417 RepID=A0AAN6W653_9PEZI|nr:S-adenosyl-L-methionine-dependent methyltransferase [Podospora setosa]
MATTQTETRLAGVLSGEKAATKTEPVHLSFCGIATLSIGPNRGAPRNAVWTAIGKAPAGAVMSNIAHDGRPRVKPKGDDDHNTNLSPVSTSSAYTSDPRSINGSKSTEGCAQLLHLAQEITASMTNATAGSEPARLKVATAALDLAAAVRPPSDTVMSLFSNMAIVSAIRIFQHWGVFDLIPTDPTRGMNCCEIARQIDAEEGIVSRISSMLTASHILSLSSTTGELSHTPTSSLLRSTEPMAAMFDLMYTNIVQVADILPAYFDTYGKKEPVGVNYVPATVLTGEAGLGYFESLANDEERMRRFTRAMGVAVGRVPVTGLYPLEEVMMGQEDDRVLWVDVGGGGGHVLRRFRESYSVLRKGRCVVIDLGGVVEEGRAAVEKDEVMRGVEWVEGDFMREVPVKGARFYYLRHILRDYSDPVATLILQNVARAMDRDSRVLVSEQINPDGVGITGRSMPLYAAFKDYSMLAIGGKERSLDQFERIGTEAGLKVEAVYRDNKGTGHGVVEFVFGELG